MPTRTGNVSFFISLTATEIYNTKAVKQKTNCYYLTKDYIGNSLPTETKRCDSLCSFKTRLIISNLYSSKSKTYKLSNNYVAKN